jgi:hypothetical protein
MRGPGLRKEIAAQRRARRLLESDGSIAVDEATGEGRRIDFVVIQDGKARYAVEVTSKTASKGAQLLKERPIRQEGGTFVLDRATGELVDLTDVPRASSA